MLDFNTFKIENEEVLYANCSQFEIDKQDISNLIELAKNNNSKKIRICSHYNPNENLHEMIIVHNKDTYVKPHKHINKSETMIILDGEVDYILFDNDGQLKKLVNMSTYDSGECFYQTTREAEYHSLIIKSEWIVFIEITNGPFIKEDTVFAPFAVDENDKNKVEDFLNRFRR